MTFYCTKTYGHDVGLSCAFRQWKAVSHCHYVHGYALSFKLTFAATHLNLTNWVLDFGALKPIKEWLQYNFDHTLAVAEDDPLIDIYRQYPDAFHIRVFPNVGCEAFAQMTAFHVSQWLVSAGHAPRVRLVSVECREHGANSAIYEVEP